MNGSQAVHGVQLPQPPNDGITALRFASHSALLLLSSWDGVRGCGASDPFLMHSMAASSCTMHAESSQTGHTHASVLSMSTSRL
jgi:hypothetical protein